MAGLSSEDWQLTKRQKRILGYGSLGAAGLYFLYRAYKSDSLTALIELRQRLNRSLETGSKSLLLASECSSMVMRDLHDFLSSDTNELPQSLKQLAKLARSQEIAEATSSLAAAAARGAFSSSGVSQSEEDKGNAEGQKRPNTLEQIFNLLTTDRGLNLVQLAVGVACRSTVKAYCESGSQSDSAPPFWQQLFELGSTEKGEKLFTTSIGTFVREGTKVWMGSMEGVSGWEDFLSSLCKPERQLAVDRLTRSFVNELVVSYLKRSRHGLKQDGRMGKVAPSQEQPFPPKAKIPTAATPEGVVSKGLNIQYHDSFQPTVPPPVRHPEWTATLIEAAKHPDVRSLVLSIARTAAGECVKTSMFTTRDLLLGSPRQVPYTVLPAQQNGHGVALGEASLQQMSTRSLGTLLLFIFMPVIIFLAGRRAALA